jgi:hypothetical protein
MHTMTDLDLLAKIQKLANLADLQYARVRREMAKQLGLGLRVLDQEVKKMRQVHHR